MQSQMTTLKNGLRIITSSRPQTETVSLGIWVKTGSAFETDEMNGISHFLEHMVFKGTKNRDTFQISEEFENVGGQSNAYTAREFTAFYAKMLKDDAELAIDVLADLIVNPTFPEDELSKEREVVVQEIKQTLDAPDDVIFDLLQDQAFPEQPLGRTILGPVEYVRSFDKTKLQSYLKTNYAGENMVVCAVGNINHDDFVKMVEKRMSRIGAKSNFIIQPQKYKGGFCAEKRDIKQTHMVIGFEGIKYECETYYPCMVFSTIFGGGMSSRLFREIREKRGMAYTVYSFANTHTGTGLFGIYAGTTPAEMNELTTVIGEEIRKVRLDKVSEEELKRAKTQLKASMLMALESSSSSAEVLARQLLIFNRVIPVEEMVERIEKVSLQDVQDIANQMFSTTPTYTLVGDITGYPEYDKIKEMIRV